jgi:hypothetical protein
MGDAPWGRIPSSWPEVVVVTQPLEAKLRYEWMDHLMPNNMGVVRPVGVLVVGTGKEYMTI